MADDDKTDSDAGTSGRRTQRDRGARSADEAPARHPVQAPRTLTRNELETLRWRLQKKFH